MLSDHHFIHSRINIAKERASKSTICYRKIKSINHGDFKRDLTEAVKYLTTWTPITQMNLYTSTIKFYGIH